MRRQVIYVPIVTAKQLVRIERIVDKLGTLGAAFDDHWRELEASLTVLNGENEPEGWKKVRVKERIRQKAKKAL